MPKLAIGHCREASDPRCLRAVLGELVLTFLFVFVGVGSAITGGKAVAAGGDTSAALIAVALGHALVVAVFATAGFHISGAHMNPAVTLSLCVGGHITLLKSAFFVVAQMLGSSLACLLLRALTGGEVTPVHALAAGVGPIQGVVSEVVFTFTLLFTIYAAILDPKSSAPGFGPLLTGLLVGANTIAGGALTGASMNPARSFGPALATNNWENHWVYWVGPLAGGPLAVAVYEFLFTVPATHQQLPVVE
ncbi:aquaporin TIP4-3 [Lolium perenne]|uniref:aquaporin TIP4-3 n=1 Tax=Lolium perenne TaxID=4522 RepID=UPI0021EAEF6B|nr:probable aquaporin TIP4-2 [Lolium perenne]